MAASRTPSIEHNRGVPSADDQCAPTLVSVIVPCYNSEHTLDATIDSILRNAREHIEVEILAIDDHSADATLHRLRTREHQIQVIAQPDNRGVSCARNAGIEQARGEFIAFCDADDIWSDDKLDRQLPLFRDPEVGLVCSSGANFSETPGDIGNSRWKSRFKRGRVYEDLLARNFIGTSTTVVRRAALKDLRFNPSLRHAEDFDLWLRIAREWNVDYVDAPLIHYRLSPSQASRNWVAMHESRLRIIRQHVAATPRPRRRRYILSRAWFAYAMEHWDVRDFSGARSKLLRAIWLYPWHARAWSRLLPTLVPAPALRQLLRIKAWKRKH